MRLIKISFIAVVLGLVFMTISYVAAGRLEESKSYSFPESVGRHYSFVSNSIFEGQSFGGRAPTLFKKSLPIDPTHPIDTIDVETTAVKIEILPSETETIDIELLSNRVDPQEPLLVDASRGKTLRLITREENADRVQRRGWMSFNFSDEVVDGKEPKQNTLVVRVPKSVTTVQLRTVSSKAKLATAVSKLRFQSTSGSFRIATEENPLSRVEDLSMETVSGSLRGPGRFDRLKFSSISGHIRLTSLDRVLEVDAKSVSGNFKIETNEPLDASVNFETKSGNIKIDDDIRGKTKIHKNVSVILGKGTARLKFESVSGDLRIKRVDGDVDSDVDRNDDEKENLQEDESSADARRESPGAVPLLLAGDRDVLVAKLFRSADSSFLTCVARVAIESGARMGSVRAGRCIRVLA